MSERCMSLEEMQELERAGELQSASMCAVQVVSLGAAIVAAQWITPLCTVHRAESLAEGIVLREYQRIRTVQAAHPSVKEFIRRVEGWA